MGGKGSGSFPDNPNHRGGREKKSAVSVVGTGLPEKPDDLPPGVEKEWYRLVELTQGVTFSQDSDILGDLAWMCWQHNKYRLLIRDDPTNSELLKDANSIQRQKTILYGQLGLTAKARGLLLVPSNEAEEEDELERVRNM